MKRNKLKKLKMAQMKKNISRILVQYISQVVKRQTLTPCIWLTNTYQYKFNNLKSQVFYFLKISQWIGWRLSTTHQSLKTNWPNNFNNDKCRVFFFFNPVLNNISHILFNLGIISFFFGTFVFIFHPHSLFVTK